MKKIGIMGGTFNPIHVGHLMIAQRAYEEYHLDEIVFLPVGNPPHKDSSQVLDASHRAAMIQLAIKEHPDFSFSDMEIKKRYYSYTSESLQEFHKMNPDAECYFIVGADSLDYMEDWHDPQTIFANATILAAQRGNLDQEKMEAKIKKLEQVFHASIKLLHVPNVEISSNWIRKTVKEGYSIRYYVPDAVETYIKEHGLYQ